MKIFIVLFTIFVASLAAPRDVTSNIEKLVKSNEEPIDLKEIIPDEKVIELSPSDYTNEEKIVLDSVEKTEDKVKEEEKNVEEKIADDIEPEVAASEEKPIAIENPILDVNNEDKDKTVTDAEEKEMDLNEYSAICQASTGATVEQISAINKDPADDAPRAVKCYVKCIAEHLGVVKDQVLQKDVAVATKPSTLSMDELDLAVDTCSNLKTDDPCDSSYLRYSCYFRTTGQKVRII